MRIPAAIGSAFVQNDERPAVARARPRWNESWIRVKARPWHAHTGMIRSRNQPPYQADFVPTSAAAYIRPAARPNPAPGARSGATGPIESPAAIHETTNQPPTASQDACSARFSPPASEAARKTSPTTAMPTPIYSRRGRRSPSARCAKTASRAIPPAETACTSESGARCTATMYKPQPATPIRKATRQRRWPKRTRSDHQGRRTVSRGRRDVIVCWATHDQLNAAAVRSASTSPMTREAWGKRLTGLGLPGGFRAYRRTAPHPGDGSCVRRRACAAGRRPERHRPSARPRADRGDGRARHPRGRDPGGVRRGRARLRRRGARVRGDRARRGGVPDADLRPRGAELAVAPAIRDGGAEAPLARAAGEGREARVLRADGAGGGLGCGVDALDRAARGRRVRPQRAEELDLLRVGLGSRPGVRENRPRRFAQGNQCVRPREGDARLHDARPGAQARHLGRVDRRALLRERRGAGREPRRRGGPGVRDRDVRPRSGAIHGRRGCVRRRARVPRAVGRVRPRAEDFRAGDRPLPVRAGHDREDGARLRDVEAARDAGGVDEERGAAFDARDVTREVARDGVGVRGGASRGPGVRLVRLRGGDRDRAVLPERPRADHLRGDDADPQAAAGRARARLPRAERQGRRRLAALRLGAGARSRPPLAPPAALRQVRGTVPRTWPTETVQMRPLHGQSAAVAHMPAATGLFRMYAYVRSRCSSSRTTCAWKRSWKRWPTRPY